jgi:cytochrome c-type biogenesis protein CcmH/NrfG
MVDPRRREGAEAMNLPRLSTRHLLMLVTVAAIALGLDAMRRRRAEFTSRMAYHSTQYRGRVRQLAVDRAWGMSAGREAASPGPIDRALVRYHFKMAEKYARAARYPWLSVEPDPPEPE